MADLKPFSGELDAPVSLKPFDGALDGETPKPIGGFGASVKQAAGAVVKGLGQAAEDFIPGGIAKNNAVKQYGQRVIDENPTAIKETSDILESPWTATKEAAGNAVGSMGGSMGARALGMGITAAAPLTGPFAPATALAGQVIANVGPFVMAAAPSFGGIREKQIAKDPNSESSIQDKAVAALGAGTVGLIENKFGPQALALKAMTKEGRAAIGKTFAETTLAKGIGYGALKGAATEGAEELVQNPIEQVAAYDDPRTSESIKETLFGGAMGALGGGVLGGGMGAVNQVLAKDPSQSVPVVPPVPPVEPAPTVEQVPPLQIGNTPDPAKPSTPDRTFIDPETGLETTFFDGGMERTYGPPGLDGLAPEAAPVADMGNPITETPAPAKPSEAMGLTPTAAPSLTNAAIVAVDSGVHQGIALEDAAAADQAAYEQATTAQQEQAAEQDTADKPITTGPLADATLSEDDKRAVLYSNQPVVDGGEKFTGTQDGDILNGMGAPFATKFGAQRRARMEGKDWTIASVFDGYVARRKDALNDTSTTPAGVDQPATTASGDQPIGSGMPAVGPLSAASGNAGDTGTTGAPAVASDPVLDAGSGADSVAPSGTSATQPAADTGFASKQIPDMTDEELQQAKAHYPADHKRAPKITKEINRRALVAKLKPASQPTENTSAQTNQTQPQQTKQPEAPAAAVAPELVKTKTTQGITTYVQKSDLNGDQDVIRMFTKDGKSNGRIHRENLDPTGEKQAARNSDNASNPLFDVVTTKEGGTFATVVAARRTLNQKGLQATHVVAKASDVSDSTKGFVIRKREAPVVEQVPAQKPEIVVDKAEMRPYRKPDGSVGYEAVPIQNETPAVEVKPDAVAPAKPDTLSDKEKAAKAKMFNALGKLAALAGKNTRMNWTPEEEQQLLPIVIELFDGAMELGSVTFQKAVRYVRAFIAGNLDQATADAIPFETLQGAYIHTARKYKDQGATTGKEVMSFDSLEELDKSAEKADSTKATEGNKPTLSDSLLQAIRQGNMPKDNQALKKLVETFDGKPADQSRMKEAQEQLEVAIVMAAREVVGKNEGDKSTFDALLRLYESQPNLNIRTSTSIANQAYSTPAPLAYLASKLAGITNKTVAMEPTGGTGMLLIGANPDIAVVNELNDLRVALLKEQGFKPTQKDAATDNLTDAEVDVVITNPPFGSVKGKDDKPIKVKVDNYDIGQIDHLIAARALAKMKEDGKAVLIIGANKVQGGLSTDDRIFFNWLYAHYNVTGHFEVNGDLYTRQGAGWPVRVIVINGRQKSNKFAPVAGTIQRADNWSQVYEQYKQILDTSGKPLTGAGVGVGSSSGGKTGAASAPAASGPKVSSPDRQGSKGSEGSTGNVAGASAGVVPGGSKSNTKPVGHVADEQRLNGQSSQPSGLEPSGSSAKPASTGLAKPAGADALAPAGNEFQSPYTPRSSRKDEGVLIPANMAQPTQDALSQLEDEVGDIDEFARKELGYKTVADLHNALMGLQVDSVAMSIHQIQKGKAVVIADQTGIGKGRQAAAIIRWAARTGKTPVFVSVKPSLFTDMYGDLADIGTNDVNPFIMNSDAWVAGEDGVKLFANRPGGHKATLEEIAATGSLPDSSNALFMTYSQINVNNVQRQALMALAPNAVFILDESHNAAGASATGQFMIDTLGLAKGVTYLSATYAKRPDNMPLYFKTDIGEAAADTTGLADAMASGGLPLQTVVSNNLVKAGQMFRRERSYDGVSITSTFDTANRALHERMSNEATSALRAIVEADRMFHDVYVKQLADDLANQGATVIDNAGNQASAGVQHTEFSSVVHNFVKQMLLGLKAQTAANEAIASLKRGEKPIIAVENTMGSFLNEYAAANGIAQGDSLGAFDYRTVLSRALARTRVITEKAATGEEVKRPVPLSELDSTTRATYDKAQKVIDGLVLDIPVSPIDWMRAEIIRAGFSVAEITGRNLSVDYSNPKKPTLTAIDLLEQKDKVNTTRQFNSGKLDALVLNVAGSTGISLHASEKFEDQRQRHMIVAQAAGDINIFMQMLGRIHRTGQVRLPKYTILSVDLPTEKRPTAVLSVKMKSLNANTSSNTESATSVKSSDILNKYGDQIVAQYLSDNFRLMLDLGIAGDQLNEDDLARKATGRLALQPIEVQHTFYDEVEAQYHALIDYLNKTNQNDLEPRTFDFDAKETRTEILFDGPNKATPFGEDAIYGEYSIKAQGVPMKPVEIRAAMASHLEGKTGKVHASDLVESMLQIFTDQMNASREKHGLVPGNFDEDKYRAFMTSLYGEGNAEQFVEKAKEKIAAGGQVEAISKETMRNVAGNSAGMDFIRSHPIGSTFRVDINSEPYNAVVTNIHSTHKSTGNPFSLSKIQLTVAVNGSLRSLNIPATQFRKIEVSGIAPGFQVEQLFKEQPPNQRETAKIVTGNLLAAYGEIKGARGTIITFTKQDGTSEQGILLPKLFDFTKNTQGDYRLKTGDDALKFLQKSEDKDIGRFGIMSRDGIVRVLPSGQGIRVQVPKSKLKGGKFFLDKGLIATGGDFVSSGNFMVSMVYEPTDAVKMLELLMKKQALYALPSMAPEARGMFGETEAAPNDGAVFSTRTSAPEKQLPLNQIERLVQSALRGMKNAPTVRVVASPEAIGLRSPVDTVPSGVTLANGDVYVFQSGVGSVLDVDMVVFHEVFHKGLQNVMPKADYVAAMQEIAKADSKVREYSSDWSASNAGKAALTELAEKYSGKELADQYEALAIEEGLARIAEDLKAKREMGSKDMGLTVRRLVAWLAKVADKMGMTRFADKLRAMSYNEAERFVIATIGKAGGSDSAEVASRSSGGFSFGAATINYSDANPEETSKVQAGVEGKSLIDAARFIQETGTPAQAEIARMVISKLDRLKVSGANLRLIVAHRGDQVPAKMGNARGYTDIALDDKGYDVTVWINGADVTGKVGTDYETVLHELVHAATTGMLFSGQLNPNSLAGKHAKDLKAVTSAIASHIVGRFEQADAGKATLTPFETAMRTGANNAFNEPDEVIAWAMTSRDAQRYLEDIPYKSTNLWTEFVQAIRTLLGFSPSAQTALSEVLRVAENLMTGGGDVTERGTTSFWHKRGMKMIQQQAANSIALPHNNSYKPENLGWAKVGGNGPNDGVRYSAQNGTSATDRFKARDIGDTLSSAANSVRDGLTKATVTDLKHQFGNRLADFRGLGLQTLGRRQLVDLYAGDLPQMEGYSRMVAQMDADKNESGAEADALATGWGKLKDERQLAELMHDATLAQIDPDKAFVEGDDQNFYDALRDGFTKLTPEAKAAYRKARDMYSGHNDKVRDAIRERIMRSEMSSAKKQALLAKMDGEFFKKVKGVYFPLARFGQYVTIVKDSAGNVLSANRSETMNEAEATRKILLAKFPAAGGYKVGKVLKDKEFNAARDGVGRGFMADLFETLDKTNAGEELTDAISQLYLAALPDLSWAKHGIHRKGTPGFSQDARRAFAQNMFHGARYLAKLRYADQLQTSLDDMQSHIASKADTDAFDSVKAQQVVDEMVKRHDSMMNPATNPISTALTSFGFVFHLGLSPASALVNLSQTALVAYPVMGAKWGFGKASAALLNASRQAAGNKNDISKALNGEELEAYNEAVRAGVIDVTMAHDLAGIAQGEDSKVSAKIRPVMKAASFLFHHAEKFNRQVTFVAAYRLAKESGAGHLSAYDQAVKATYDGHFDYSASNRPRVMQGNVAKVVLLFKQYSQNMVYTLTRQAQLSLNAATPAERAEARKALGGLLASHALAAGALGLPMVGMLLSAASAIGGDDDEPWDAKVAFQNMLADTLGQKPAEVFAHGLSRLTPWDISGRVGLDKLLLPDVQEGLEGADAVKNWMAAALGPVAGIAVNAGKGMQDMANGQHARGLESMLPSALRAPLKAYRYGTEGNIDKTGVAINEEIGAAGVAGQALGFSPSEARLAQEGKSAIYSADRAIQARRSSLTRQFALAAMAKDQDGMADARKDIARFNEKNPKARITPVNLMQSVRARRKRIEQAEQGVYLPKKRQDAIDAGRFAVAE